MKTATGQSTSGLCVNFRIVSNLYDPFKRKFNTTFMLSGGRSQSSLFLFVFFVVGFFFCRFIFHFTQEFVTQRLFMFASMALDNYFMVVQLYFEPKLFIRASFFLLLFLLDMVKSVELTAKNFFICLVCMSVSRRTHTHTSNFRHNASNGSVLRWKTHFRDIILNANHQVNKEQNGKKACAEREKKRLLK